MKTLINELLQMIIDSSLTFDEARPLISKIHKLISLINEAPVETLNVSNNEELIKSCTNCKWMYSKFEYRCEDCLFLENYEQDD